MDSLTVNGIWKKEKLKIFGKMERFFGVMQVLRFSIIRNMGEFLSQSIRIFQNASGPKVLERERMDYQTILDAAPVMIAYKSKDDHFLKSERCFC